MGYDGTFHAAVRGPAGVLRTLPEVLSDWRKTEGKTWIAPGLENETECFLKALERVAKAAEKQVPETIAVWSWDDSWFSLTALDCAAGIAACCPEVEVAIAMGANLRGIDRFGCCAYYSAAGEDRLQPDWKGTVRGNRWEDIAASSRKKTYLPLFYPLADSSMLRWDFTKDIHNWREIDPDQFDDLSSVYLEEYLLLIQLEQHPVIGQYGVYIEPDAEYLELFDRGGYGEDEELAPVFQILTPSYDSPRRQWDISEEELDAGLRTIYPSIEFVVTKQDGLPLVSDVEGNSYLLGGLFQIGDSATKIEWGFPPQASWIPFA